MKRAAAFLPFIGVLALVSLTACFGPVKCSTVRNLGYVVEGIHVADDLVAGATVFAPNLVALSPILHAGAGVADRAYERLKLLPCDSPEARAEWMTIADQKRKAKEAVLEAQKADPNIRLPAAIDAPMPLLSGEPQPTGEN